MSKWGKERGLLLHTCLEMLKAGLVSGSSGNVSMRLPSKPSDLVLITPTSKPYAAMTTDELVVIDLQGEPVEGELMPSSESALHLALYLRRPDVGGVIHTHSLYASVAAVAAIEIPPLIDEMVIRVGGGVAVAPYAFPGSEELAQAACDTMGDRNAVLLRNHGLVAVGETVHQALEISQLVERIAQICVYTSLMGKLNALPDWAVKIEKEMYQTRRAADRSNEGTHGNGT